MSDECIYCKMIKGEIQTFKVFEDEHIFAFLDIKPASEGHLQVISKTHSPILLHADEITRAKMLNMALNLGQSLIVKLKATGVSYIVNEGVGANQRIDHSSIHVIPRYEDDEINISWKGKEMNNEELVTYLNGISSKLFSQDDNVQSTTQSNVSQNVVEKKPEIKQEVKPQIKKEKEKKEKDDEDDSAVKIKPRVPKYW